MWERLRNTVRRGRAPGPARGRARRPGAGGGDPDPLVTLDARGGPAGRNLLHRLLLPADLAGLARLATDLLAGVPDALALVRLGLAGGAHAGRDLPDELLVDAHHGEAQRGLDLEADPGRRVDLDRVAVAEREDELVARLLRTVADTHDLEALAVPVGDADDHVVDERPGQAVEALVELVLRRPRREQRVAVTLDLDARRQLPGERPSRALHRDDAAVERDVDARGDGDGETTDSGHGRLPDVREDLAAELGLLGLAPGHDPVRGGDDHDAEAAEHARNVGLLRVDAQARLADPLEARDDRHLAVDILELDPEHLGRPRSLLVDVGDEAFLLEDAGDLALRARGRHHDLRVTRPGRVADT